MAKAPVDIRSLARQHTTLALNTLVAIALKGKSESARANAASYLLDRGWGKAPQAHTGADGEGAIVFTIRHILEQNAAGAPAALPAPVTAQTTEDSE